jgi:hypothetical protein
VVRVDLTKQKVLDALPSIVNALNQRRVEEDRRRNEGKLSTQVHQTFHDKLNNLSFLAPIVKE